MNKIMIVEDEAVIALRLQQRLKSMGFDVAGVAYSGEEAVESARDLRPDLILTNIMIPGKLDGIQVAEIVKSALDIPVIFLTAYSEDKIIERAKQAESYGYIVKPFQNRELKSAIEFALYKKDMERRLKESKIQLQKAHDELERSVIERTNDLEIKTKSLRVLNASMKVLLEKRMGGRILLKDNLLINIKKLIELLFYKIRKTELDDHQKMILRIIESNLNEITSPLTMKL
jgi:DNA-binding response OmpR family regulator